MLKKFSVAVFLVLTFLLYLLAARIHIQEDRHRLINNSSGSEFYEAELAFPVDLKEYSPEGIISTMVSLSDKYQVNIHFEQFEMNAAMGYQGRYGSLMKAEGREFEIFIYVQQPFLFENLKIKDYNLDSLQEFNDKEGHFISNKNIESKIGHITTAHPNDTVTITTLKGYQAQAQSDLIGKFRLSSTEPLSVEGFLNEIQDEYQDLYPDIRRDDFIKYGGDFHSPKVQSSYLLKEYYQELVLLFILFILTGMLYTYNEKRAILIKKINGYNDVQVFAEYTLKLLLPGIALSLPLFFGYSLIQFGGVSPKLFSILLTYCLFTFATVCMYTLCAAPMYLHIRKIKGIELISHREDNHIFLFGSLVVKAVILPILLTSLAIGITDLRGLIQQRDDFELRSEIYQNYITFDFLSSNLNLFAGDYRNQNTYIESFPQILGKRLNLYIYQPSSGFSENVDMGEYMVTANANFINDSNLVDVNGEAVKIDSERSYVLIPEKYEEGLLNHAKGFPDTQGKLENYFFDRDYNPVEIIILKNNQKIKAFDGNGVGGYEDGYSYNNIVFSSYYTNGPRDIYIDSSQIPDYQEQIQLALAEEGIALHYSIEELKDLYQLELSALREMINENLFISILYTILVSYISALSIYLYFRTKQKEIYIKTLHGSYVTSNFKDLLSLNFLVNILVFLYMYWVRSYDAIYMGYRVPQSLPYAFGILVVLDLIFITGAMGYVKSRTLAQAVKNGI